MTDRSTGGWLDVGLGVNDPLAELFELIVCTGMRKGEALGVHWADVDLDERMLFVRYTLSNINNTTPVFTAPKTRSSRARIGLSPRAVAALRRQAERQRLLKNAAGAAFDDRGLVFTCRTGRPLRHVAHQAVEAIDTALTAAELERTGPERDHPATTATGP